MAARKLRARRMALAHQHDAQASDRLRKTSRLRVVLVSAIDRCLHHDRCDQHGSRDWPRFADRQSLGSRRLKQ